MVKTQPIDSAYAEILYEHYPASRGKTLLIDHNKIYVGMDVILIFPYLTVKAIKNKITRIAS